MKKVFLIYIPCHSDIGLAIRQAKTLRTGYEKNISIEHRDNWDLRLVLSVNDYRLSKKNRTESRDYFDQIVDFGKAFLFDANIAQGFIKALEVKPDLFWLLSTNDKVNLESLKVILESFKRKPNCDAIVAADISEITSTKITPQTDLFSNKYKFGLISGVVYNFKNMGKDFNAAPFFIWTGWSQISVITSFIQSKKILNAILVPKEILFKEKVSQVKNYEHYRHSYFGRLIFNEITRNKRRQRSLERNKFIFSNFYLHNYFSFHKVQRPYQGSLITRNHYLLFNSHVSDALLKSRAPFRYLIFKILTKIDFKKIKLLYKNNE
jgi:hypothetical protein